MPFADVNGFLLVERPDRFPSVVPWDSVPEVKSWWESSLGHVMDVSEWEIRRKTVPELRADLKARGVSPLPSKKDDLVDAVVAAEVAAKSDSLVWPSRLMPGNDLVVRCDTGPAAEVVRHLIAAGKRGSLGIGNASGPFSTGLFLYDTDEESAELRAEREAQFDWHDARMAELKPVADQLRADGYPMYFLGKPSVLDTGDGRQVVRYWMNSSTGGKLSRQIYGWFTLDELKDRSFVEKFEQKQRERAS